jgi:hypothetical protein
MVDMRLRAEGPEVLLTLTETVGHVALAWQAADDFCRSLRQVFCQARVNERAGQRPAVLVLPDRHQVTVRFGDGKVGLIFDRRLDRLRMPWQRARQIWVAVKTKARDADSVENWRRTIDDQRILAKLRVPLGITPPILRPALEGIPSGSIVGTPRLIGLPARR